MRKSPFLKIFRRLFADERLSLYRHNTPVLQMSPAEIHTATPENIKDIVYFDKPQNVEKFLEFIKRGDTGYLAYLNGNCIHRSWVGCKPGKVWLHWSLPLTLKENDAYIHFCETAPQIRGKNIFSHVLHQISEDYRHCNNIYICVNIKNHPSIRSIEKAGFAPVKHYHIIALLNRLIYKKEYE